MTEIRIKEPIQRFEDYYQLDLLFETYRLRKIRKKLNSKLKSFEKSLTSEDSTKIQYKFQVLKAVITENEGNYRQVTSQLKNWNNVFNLSELLEQNNLYITNLNKERKKGHIDSESYEITKGHYLQKLIDIKNNFSDLKTVARSYFQEIKDELINLEDKRIQLITERARKTINKNDFNEKIRENDKSKHELEEKLAFLKVKIIEYQLD
ncbi:MAG: hypothetical protein ACXAAH_06540 [Promethearchaeota archaeon]|jgi:hypothetical protein